MPVMSYIDAVTLALKEEMERDPRVFVLGEDVGKKGESSRRQRAFMSSLEKSGSWIPHWLNPRLPVSESAPLCME